MTKFNEEIAVGICEFLCGHSVVLDACRAFGISNTTFWTWVAKSRRDPPELPEITWLEITAPFHQHIHNAKTIFAQHMLDRMTERARHGSSRRITYQGKEMFMVDPSIPPDPALDADPELCMMLYGVRDRYLRDASGKMIHLTERIEPPVQLQLAVAAANFEAYQSHSSQTIEVLNRDEMGVKRVGNSKSEPVKVALAPPKPEPVEVEAQVSVTVTDAAEPVEDFSSGAEVAVEAPVDRTPAYTPPENSSKIPIGPVKIFSAEAIDDPPESLGDKSTLPPIRRQR